MYSGDEIYDDEVTSGVLEDDADNDDVTADCGHNELRRLIVTAGGKDLCRHCYAARVADVKRIPKKGK